MKKTLAEIATMLNEQFPAMKARAWEKGTYKRIYFDVGFRTKKARVDSYFFIDGLQAKLYLTVVCPSQSINWCQMMANEIRDYSSVNEALKIVQDNYDFPDVEVSDVIIGEKGDIAGLDTREVYGYYTEWRKVRIKINAYGKLAERNRMFAVLWKGIATDAPRSFVEITQIGYEYAVKNYGSELMLEPSRNNEVPDFDSLAGIKTINPNDN